jgi:outer membrane protein assembly factor BamB
MARHPIPFLARAAAVLALGIVAAASPAAAAANGGAVDWLQWGQNAAHQGAVATPAQSLDRVLAQVTYDPFVDQERVDGGGSILVHYQTPLLRGDDVFMEFKTGTYTPADGTNDATRWNSQVWNERRLQILHGSFVQRWNFQSDWKPEPADLALGWEPVFHAALTDDAMYVPGLGGTVFQVDARDGHQVARVNPFGTTVDPTIYVAGPLVADGRGSVYYNALKLDENENAVGSWLVQVRPNGSSRIASFADLVPGAPTTCVGAFNNSTLPWPPAPDALPASGPCGLQRPGLNVAPAIGPDGTVYTISRADFNERYSYVVAATRDLAPRWAASLRDRLNDGCGVLVPIAPTPDPALDSCRFGANFGVDPQTNQRPAGRVRDITSASPTVLPDGSVLYGAWTRYDAIRGHLFKFSAAGEFQAAIDFGYDSTPAVYQNDGIHIVLKENHYDGEFGRYCNPDGVNPVSQVVCANSGVAQGPFYITQLNAQLVPEWRFQNTNTRTCTRQPDGSLSCVDDTPNGFEWCINAPAVDGNGTVYGNSEDGFLYSIPQGHHGTFTQFGQRAFMGVSLGNAYTPSSIARSGVVFTSDNGALFAIGRRA